MNLFAATPDMVSETPVTSATYALYSVDIAKYDDADLTVGLRAGADNQNTWAFLSDVIVRYRGRLTDGIVEHPVTGGESSSLEIYDLQGRRVCKPSRGIYIVGRRKVVFK